jgi:predicted nucleic acid-binding protein
LTFLIDSDWVMDWLKGRPGAARVLQPLRPLGWAISLITFGEVYEGIYRSVDPPAHEATFQRFLANVAVLAPDQETMKRFTRIRGELRRTGWPVGDLDLLIAATAIHHDLTLATRNVRHYARIPDLKLHHPSP